MAGSRPASGSPSPWGKPLLGILADRVNVRWYYPLLLAMWSLMGFATGLMHTFTGLLICRVLLGLFEGGNWPCGLKTIQHLLPPAERALGSGILQSGGAIGAMLTPLVVGLLLSDELGSWRLPFLVIGAAGLSWVVLWLASVRNADLRLPADDVNLGEGCFSRASGRRELPSGGFSSLRVSQSSCVSASASICAGTCCASGCRCSCRKDAAIARRPCWASMPLSSSPPTSGAWRRAPSRWACSAAVSRCREPGRSSISPAAFSPRVPRSRPSCRPVWG